MRPSHRLGWVGNLEWPHSLPRLDSLGETGKWGGGGEVGKLDFTTPGLSLAAAPSSMRLAEKLGLGVSNSALECYSGGCTSSMATVFHVNYGAAGRAVWTGVAGKDREAWGGRRYGHGKGKGRSVVECVGVSGSGSGAGERREQQQQQSGVVKFFNVEDPRGAGVSLKKGAFDVNTAWELLRQDVLYLDWKARRDVLAIVNAHDKVRLQEKPLNAAGSSVFVVFEE